MAPIFKRKQKGFHSIPTEPLPALVQIVLRDTDGTWESLGERSMLQLVRFVPGRRVHYHEAEMAQPNRPDMACVTMCAPPNRAYYVLGARPDVFFHSCSESTDTGGFSDANVCSAPIGLDTPVKVAQRNSHSV